MGADRKDAAKSDLQMGSSVQKVTDGANREALVVFTPSGRRGALSAGYAPAAGGTGLGSGH